MPYHKIHIQNHNLQCDNSTAWSISGVARLQGCSPPMWGWNPYWSTLGFPCSTMWACHLWHGKQTFVRQFASALTLDFQKFCAKKKKEICCLQDTLTWDLNIATKTDRSLTFRATWSQSITGAYVCRHSHLLSPPLAVRCCPLWPRALSDLNSYIWLLIATTFSFCKEVRL